MKAWHFWCLVLGVGFVLGYLVTCSRRVDGSTVPLTRVRSSSPAPPVVSNASDPLRVLRGAVVDGRSEAVAGARVCAWKTGAIPVESSLCTTSDFRGQFVLTLPSASTGAWTVHAGADGFEDALVYLDVMSDGAETLRLVLRNGGGVRGVVMDAAGGPIAGATLIALDGDGKTKGFAISSGDGSLTLGVQDGVYALLAFAEGYARRHEDSALTRTHPFRVVLTPEAVLRGVVHDELGHPLAGASVRATRAKLPVVGVSLADGTFELRGLEVGEQLVLADLEDRGSDAVNAWMNIGTNTLPAPLVLRAIAHLEAKVNIEGAPCTSGELYLEPRSEGAVPLGAQVEQGTAVLRASPGAYRCTIRCEGALPHVEEIVLSSGRTTKGWDLSPGNKVVGRLVTAAGRPLAGRSLDLFHKPVEVEAGGELAQVGRCLSDQRGAFECSGLEAGPVVVRFSVGAHVLAEAHTNMPQSGPLELVTPQLGSIVVQYEGDWPPGIRLTSKDGLVFETGEHVDGAMVVRDVPVGVYRLGEELSSVDINADDAVVRVHMPTAPLGVLSGVVTSNVEDVSDIWIAIQGSTAIGLGRARWVLTDEQGHFEADLPAGVYGITAVWAGGSAKASGATGETTTLSLDGNNLDNDNREGSQNE